VAEAALFEMEGVAEALGENVALDDAVVAFENAVETGMNRVMSEIEDRGGDEGGDDDGDVNASTQRSDSAPQGSEGAEARKLRESGREKIEGKTCKAPAESEEDKVRREAEMWVGQGLGLGPGAKVMRGQEAVQNAVQEALQGMMRGAVLGGSAKGALALVMALLGRRLSLAGSVRQALGKDTRRFALFLGTFSAVFRGLNAAFTSWSGRDAPENAAAAGALAGLTLLMDEPSRRQSLALFLFTRSLDLVVKRLVRLGMLPYWKYFENFMFGVSNMPIMFGFLLMPEILQPSYYKWILNMGAMNHEGLDRCLRVEWRKGNRGEKTKFIHCCNGYHDGPCTPYCMKDWVIGLLRAAKVYLPVHFVPMILFRYKSLLKDPQSQLLRTFQNFANSCAFLTSYVFVIKSTQCFLRNLRKKDVASHALLSGLLTSFATLFEQPSRVSELSLYCIPRGLEATWKYGVLTGRVRYIKYFEVLLMSFATATLLGSAKTDFKHSYYSALRFLVGTKPSPTSTKKEEVTKQSASEATKTK